MNTSSPVLFENSVFRITPGSNLGDSVRVDALTTAGLSRLQAWRETEKTRLAPAGKLAPFIISGGMTFDNRDELKRAAVVLGLTCVSCGRFENERGELMRLDAREECPACARSVKREPEA